MSKKLRAKVLVIGGGAWGFALANQLAKKTQVYLWDRNKQLIAKLQKTKNHPLFPWHQCEQNLHFIDELISLENVLIATDSTGFKAVLQNPSWQTKAKNIAFATKGILMQQPYFLTEVFNQTMVEIGNIHQLNQAVVLSGPSFAKEVLQNHPTAITVASFNIKKAQFWAQFLNTDQFRPYLSDDPLGVSIAGALKNIYAIVCGISAGLGYGANTSTLIIHRSLREMIHFALSQGAKKETLLGLAAMGDLVLTSLNDLSRNRQFGKLIAQGFSLEKANEKLGKLVEGINTLKPSYQIMLNQRISMPILTNLYQVIYQGKKIEDAMRELFSRDLTYDGLIE